MKKYRTMIEIVSEASSKNEALDIVGEFLSGNITSGVQMKCATDPVQSYARITVVTMLFLVLLGGSIFSALYTRPGSSVISATPAASAVQLPLKTSVVQKDGVDFKNAWQTMQVKEALSQKK